MDKKSDPSRGHYAYWSSKRQLWKARVPNKGDIGSPYHWTVPHEERNRLAKTWQGHGRAIDCAVEGLAVIMCHRQEAMFILSPPRPSSCSIAIATPPPTPPGGAPCLTASLPSLQIALKRRGFYSLFGLQEGGKLSSWLFGTATIEFLLRWGMGMGEEGGRSFEEEEEGSGEGWGGSVKAVSGSRKTLLSYWNWCASIRFCETDGGNLQSRQLYCVRSRTQRDTEERIFSLAGYRLTKTWKKGDLVLYT